MNLIFQCRCLFSLALMLTISSSAIAQQETTGQETTGPKKLTVGTLKEGLSVAKANGMPLVIFGLTDT